VCPKGADYQWRKDLDLLRRVVRAQQDGGHRAIALVFQNQGLQLRDEIIHLDQSGVGSRSPFDPSPHTRESDRIMVFFNTEGLQSFAACGQHNPQLKAARISVDFISFPLKECATLALRHAAPLVKSGFKYSDLRQEYHMDAGSSKPVKSSPRQLDSLQDRVEKQRGLSGRQVANIRRRFIFVQPIFSEGVRYRVARLEQDR
jgi:hypothetical protein